MKKIENILKQFLLKLLLKTGSSKSSNSTTLNNINFKYLKIKILLIRLNRIGDALVTTPLIKVLKNNLDCEIEVLSDSKNHFIFENNPYVDRTIIFEKGLGGILRIRKYINESKFDFIVDTHDDVSTTVSYIVAMSKSQFKFGLKKSNEIIFTNTVARLDAKNHHVVKRILKLSELFGIKPNFGNCNTAYFPTDKSIEYVQEYLSGNFTEKRFLFGINISAGSSARFWGVERFQKLLDLISDKDTNIVIISPPQDRSLAENISLGKYPVFSEKEFDKAAALISQLDLLFTPDTSLVHIASAFNVPVFGLYVKYKTDDVIWYPYKSKYDAVITEEPNFDNLNFEQVQYKFMTFFESVFNDFENKNYEK